MNENAPSLWERVKSELTFRAVWLVSTALAATVRFRIDGWEKLEKVVGDGKGLKPFTPGIGQQLDDGVQSAGAGKRVAMKVDFEH